MMFARGVRGRKIRLSRVQAPAFHQQVESLKEKGLVAIAAAYAYAEEKHRIVSVRA